MLSLFQLLLAVFAIYSTINFEEELRLTVPLICLVVMFIVSRVDKRQSEKEDARKSFLKSELDRVLDKDQTTIKEQDFFTIESLLWPKSEMLLVDAVHLVFKELGFKISTGINYSSIDRVIKIPNSKEAFGLEILMSEKEAGRNHPKITRALQFENEKKEGEKTLVIASTYSHLPLSERDQMRNASEELHDLLVQHSINFVTTYQLYQLWQKSKGGEVDLFDLFRKIYYHPGGIFASKGMENGHSLAFDRPLQQA